MSSWTSMKLEDQLLEVKEERKFPLGKGPERVARGTVCLESFKKKQSEEANSAQWSSNPGAYEGLK